MLSMDLHLLIFTAIVFIVLLVILNKILYQPLLSFVGNRDKTIFEDQKHASKNEGDIVAYEEEAKNIILDVKNKIFREKSKAIEVAKEEIAKKIEEKKVQLDNEYFAFQNELDKEKEALKKVLQDSIPSYRQSIKAKLSQL